MVTGRYLQVQLLTGGHLATQTQVLVITGGGGRPPPHRTWSQDVVTGRGHRTSTSSSSSPHPTHFPSTRIFALEPLNSRGFGNENQKRDPQAMLGVFENFPSVFSWGFATSPVLKNSPRHGTGETWCMEWPVVGVHVVVTIVENTVGHGHVGTPSHLRLWSPLLFPLAARIGRGGDQRLMLWADGAGGHRAATGLVVLVKKCEGPNTGHLWSDSPLGALPVPLAGRAWLGWSGRGDLDR